MSLVESGLFFFKCLLESDIDKQDNYIAILDENCALELFAAIHQKCTSFIQNIDFDQDRELYGTWYEAVEIIEMWETLIQEYFGQEWYRSM